MSHDLNNSELQCLRDVRYSADELNIPVILVGANARRLVFDSPNRIHPYRTTLDWDFGVRVSSWDMFRKLRARFLQTRTFKPGRYEHRLTHAISGIEIDLVPFGGLEFEGRIQWPESKFEMNVTGFSDAYDNAVELDVDESVRFHVATAPLLVVLKFFAFADRRDGTDRDLVDLWHFVQNYLTDAQSLRLWEDPIASAIDESFDWNYGGPFLVGYDLASACKPQTVERLKPIIAELSDPYSRHIQPLVQRIYLVEHEEQQRLRISKSFQWLGNGIGAARNLRRPLPPPADAIGGEKNVPANGDSQAESPRDT